MGTTACLSPFTEQQVGALAGTEDVTVPLVPEAVSGAEIVIGDMRQMRRCRLVQQPAFGFDVIDHVAAAEFGVPVANAAGSNAGTVADWTITGMLNVVRCAPG